MSNRTQYEYPPFVDLWDDAEKKKTNAASWVKAVIGRDEALFLRSKTTLSRTHEEEPGSRDPGRKAQEWKVNGKEKEPSRFFKR